MFCCKQLFSVAFSRDLRDMCFNIGLFLVTSALSPMHIKKFALHVSGMFTNYSQSSCMHGTGML